MKTRNLIFGAISFMIILVVTNCKTDHSDSVASKSAVKDVSVTGQELFRLNCAGCHGVNRKGNPPTYPSLVNIKTKQSKVDIVAQVKNGKGSMPSLAHLSDEEI